MAFKKYPYGTVTIHETEYTPTQIVRITGVSNIGPEFVNTVDENIWKNIWNNKSKVFNITYVHGQDRFDKDRRNSYWSDKDVNKFEEEIISLTQEYNSFAKKYNSEIEKPFIKERRRLLENLFE